jgi:hypothetical protein
VDQVTNELVQELTKDGDMHIYTSAQSINVGNVEGRSTVFESTSPFPTANGQTQKERDWMVTVPRRDGSVLYLIFVAPAPEFDRFQPTFQAMLNSVQVK